MTKLHGVLTGAVAVALALPLGGAAQHIAGPAPAPVSLAAVTSWLRGFVGAGSATGGARHPDGGRPVKPKVMVANNGDADTDELGLEKFYQYSGMNTGGSNALVNLHNGNAVWSYNAYANPSRGLSTFLRVTYNSLDVSSSAIGAGWSLAPTTLNRLGSPLKMQGDRNWPSEVAVIDGDGTRHTFKLNKHGSKDTARWDYDHPAGVHLYLQKAGGTDASRTWVMTKPERTRFYFDADGYQTAIADRSDNELRFAYADRAANNDPTRYLQSVTDPAGRRTLALTYYAKGDAYQFVNDAGDRVDATNLGNSKIIGLVRSVTDVSGRRTDFAYTEKGRLGQLVDGAGTSVAKTYRFQYDKDDKLVRVVDPRGGGTRLSYADSFRSNSGPKGRVQSMTSRVGGAMTFDYSDADGKDGADIKTTVTDPESHASQYVLDGRGRPIKMTNAKGQLTRLGWDADNNVVKLEENNHAATTWTYDPKTGYPLTTDDAEANAGHYAGIRLSYRSALNGYVADLVSKTSAEGRKWTFGYDPAGRLTSVTDPAGTATPAAGDYTTTYTYDATGQLLTSTDANQHTTSYGDYDPVGYPKTTTDPLRNASHTEYDVRGNVVSSTDGLGKTSTYGYDTFGRPLDSKVPKDQAAGVYIVTPAPTYDANDNVVNAVAPNGAVTGYTYDAADRMTSATAPKYADTDPDRVTKYAYDQVGNLIGQTEPLGNKTTYSYDKIDELVSVTDAANARTTYSYDDVGNVVKLVDGRKNATPDGSDYAGRFEYDKVHRRTTVTDAAGKTASKEYNRDGDVVAQVDRDCNRTLIGYDARGKMIEVKVPRAEVGGKIEYAVTHYEYDQVGNQTKVISPRGVATTADPDDFAQVTTYDELNRVKEQILPYDKADSHYNNPDRIVRSYDATGRLTKVSAPPSQGQSVRNDTDYTYFDNGWIAGSADPWDILTTYDYDALGKQTRRTVSSAGGSAGRTMTWDYFPDGSLRSRGDNGVPVGLNVVLVDNSDSQNVDTTGAWPATSDRGDHQGYDYATHAPAVGDDAFTWRLNVTQAGAYEVFVRYPQGEATDAPYTVSYDGGSTTKPVDQTHDGGRWVSLGRFPFAEGDTQTVKLGVSAGGAVNADAVKLVRDNSGDVDTESKDYTYRYDANGNMTAITDGSSGARADSYQISYDAVDRATRVEERKAATVQHTTGFSYDENGAVLSRTHDGEIARYEYDVRGLLSKVTQAESATDPKPKVTSYAYTALGKTKRQTQANGNVLDYEYLLDGALRHQIEKKPDGAVVGEHTYEYDLNDNRTKDTSRQMNADNHAATIDRLAAYTYDPRDRVASVVKTDSANGNQVGSESYLHDANGNVVSETINGTTTTSTYNRNRLVSASRGGVPSRYNYDPFGRLDTVTIGGQAVQRFGYDGFDRMTEQRTGSAVTRTTYDPLDRPATKTDKAGTPNAKTTMFAYLGLTDQVLNEESGGKAATSYQYTPWGERLSQVKTGAGGTKEDSYFAYNAHTDVEAVTDDKGETRATYGYTAYGADDQSSFTGVDKPDAQDPTKQPYNVYRFNSKRWDPAGGTYDMGFRNYDPGLNRFLTRDSYNGALSDLRLGTDPWTMNRYAFAGGNPVTGIEIDGHISGHDAAVVATAAEIQAWATTTGTKGHVTIDVGVGGRTANKIPGGHRSGNGNDGVADIIFWGEDTVYIWEVKPGNEGGKLAGPPQLDRYIVKLQEHLKAQGDTRLVAAGPPMPRVGGVPSAQGPIDVWSEGPGMRYYGNSKTPRPAPPPPVTVPVPDPVKVPVQQPVPNPQPGPPPTPPTTDDQPWSLPGWVKPVAGGLAILGGALLIGGTIAEDVGTGGVGILDDPVTIGGGTAAIRAGWALVFG
jgi:RHS repeat-associated protein